MVHTSSRVFFFSFLMLHHYQSPKKDLGLIGKIFVKRTIQTSVFLCVKFVPNVKIKKKEGTVFHNIPKKI